MTRLLVVHPNPLVAWDRAAALEHAGYEVEICGGPAHAGCPVIDDQACPLLDGADALIYDAALGSTGEMRLLVEHLRDMYADLPLVLIGAADASEWARVEGDQHVWHVPQVGTVAELVAVVEEALTEQGMAV
jgi:hypothetical protein